MVKSHKVDSMTQTSLATLPDTADTISGNLAPSDMPPKQSLLSQLISGNSRFPIIIYRKQCVIISITLVIIGLLLVFFKGFHLGIEFSGGSEFTVPASARATNMAITNALESSIKVTPISIQHVGSGVGASAVIKTRALTVLEHNQAQNALFQAIKPVNSQGQISPDAISYSDVSGSWGAQITHKALIALIVFLIVISIYIIVRFEWEMALAALASLIFDLSVTAGIYALTGLEVTPSTVVGLLTIMGFSLYDTVVVFDKVKENTSILFKQSTKTYAELTNIAVNQTLMRSINTTIISIVPILSLMIVAVILLGIGTLQDLATVQLIGIIVGAFSSIFLATPCLVIIKERRAEIARHTNRIKKRSKTV